MNRPQEPVYWYQYSIQQIQSICLYSFIQNRNFQNASHFDATNVSEINGFIWSANEYLDYSISCRTDVHYQDVPYLIDFICMYTISETLKSHQNITTIHTPREVFLGNSMQVIFSYVFQKWKHFGMVISAKIKYTLIMLRFDQDPAV